MKKSFIMGVWTLLLITVLTVPAFAEELIVGGQAVGVQISTDGVLVAGLCTVDTGTGELSPAENAGIQQGDLIVSINGSAVPDAAAVVEAVENSSGDLALELIRGGSHLNVTVEPACSSDGERMLGLWLRDGLSGIGTLTFCDPESGTFGALGHSINDASSGLAVPVREGSITDAQIVSVVPGSAGSPGELNGCADPGNILGTVEVNTDEGIFGSFTATLDGRRIETGIMTAGPASVVSTINGREAREYAVEINRIYRETDSTHAMFSVTDAELLSKTGGIVQGMSGSPIIQNGRLVGAVTHVFVSDPSRGYAVSIQDMLRSAGISDLAA